MIARSRLLAVLAVGICGICGVGASSASAAAPGWMIIGATGPTHLPPRQSEIQRLIVDGEGGTFTLTARHPAASGFGTPSSKTIKNVSTLSGTFEVGQSVEGPGIFEGTVITGVSGSTLSLNNTTTSKYPIAFSTHETPETTGPLPYDASAAEAQAALEALPVLGSGNVQVTGGPGGPNAEHPYTVTFRGALADTDVSLLVPDSAAITEGHVFVFTPVNGGLGTSSLMLAASNIGAVNSSGTITYRATLPPGFVSTGEPVGKQSLKQSWNCGASTSTELLCTRTQAAPPSIELPPIIATVMAEPGVEGGTVEMEVSGGGAATVNEELPLTVSPTPAKPGVQSFTAGAFDENGLFDTRAGGHPYTAASAIFVNTVRSGVGNVVPAGEFRDITVELPPGFLGNPIATPQCPESVPTFDCPLDSMVGIVQPTLAKLEGEPRPAQIYNTEAPYGYPGKFRFVIGETVPLSAVGTLRSDGDYGINVGSLNTPQISTVYGTFFTFWGEPASPAYDSFRCRRIYFGINLGCEASDAENTAFLTSATNCAEQAASPPIVNFWTTLWQNPGEIFRGSRRIPAVTECDKLHFKADFTFEPSDTMSDSPASFRTSLTVPEEGLTDPSKLTTPEIQKTVVQLPEGVTLNPSGADGLQACTEQQIGYLGSGFPMPNPMRFDKDPNTCPEASKIGTGELKSALIAETLHGALYLAAQGEGNPFGSLFAVYLVIEDPRHGIFVKLPGEVEPDKKTGQFKVTFDNLPQLPFTRLDLNLKGGNRSALASPVTCGNYVTTATNTPWSAPESGPPTVSSNGFEINQGPNGQPCAPTKAARPFDVGLKAGTDSASADSYSPLSFQITRPDGSQELDTLDLKTAPGLSAKLAGIPQCSDGAISSAQGKTGRQEQASPSCSSSSQIGRAQVGAGAGPTPFYSEGKLYLAGPYKGAPLSVVAITPAVAGPFDLGNVVVRTAVYLDRSTAQVTAKSDPIPQILEGVPLRIRDVRIILDRKDFSLTPTSCEASQISTHLTGNSGASKDLTARFQVGGCGDLAFKPKFWAKVKGGTKRGKHPQFLATVNWPEGGGYANTKDVQVTLPHSEFLDQAHIRTICTRVQALADACPPGSIYGYAEATTPLLDGKLSGPVFLKSSNHKLPDLAIKLKGPDSMPVEVEFAGRIDSIHSQIRNTIENLPDVPVSQFTLHMRGGKKGLLINSRNLCTTRKVRLNVNALGQNNSASHLRPLLHNSCHKVRKRKRHHRRAHGKR